MPLTSAELAQRTNTSERYIREWLANQAAGGYVAYDEADDTYYLTPEQELCLADLEQDPVVEQSSARESAPCPLAAADVVLEADSFRGDSHAEVEIVVRTRELSDPKHTVPQQAWPAA